MNYLVMDFPVKNIHKITGLPALDFCYGSSIISDGSPGYLLIISCQHPHRAAGGTTTLYPS